MASNKKPVFGNIPRVRAVQLSGTIESSNPREPVLPDQGIKEIYEADTAGAILLHLVAKATGSASSALGLLLIFISDPDGSNIHLLSEFQIEAIAPATTIPSFEKKELFDQVLLEPGQKLYVGMLGNSVSTNVIATLGDFKDE